MAQNNKYWQDRMVILEEAQLQKGEKYLEELDQQYRKAARNIEKELSGWYHRFAVNNQITMTEARKLLTADQLKEFQWDVKDYIKYGEQNAFTQEWMKELENASAKVHISRLESLKLQLQQEVEVLYGNQLDNVDDLMRDVFQNGYYHTAWEVQRGFNVGWDLHKLDDDLLDKFMSKPWTLDKKTFSDRLWTNKAAMVNDLQTYLTQSVITGKVPDQIIKAMAGKFNTDRNKAGRLVMTETAAFNSISQQQAFKDLDVERYEIVATLDGHTSEICQGLDGEVFEMKDYAVGVTAPPFHPWCRTTTAPYFDDEFALGERAARDSDGNTYYVPSDIKYPDWYNKFIEGGSKEGMTIIDSLNMIEPVKELTFQDKIQQIKDDIAAQGGSISEENLQKAGAIVREELEADRKKILDELEDLKQKRDSMNMAALDQQMSDVKSVRRGLRKPDEIGLPKDINEDDLQIKLKELETEIMEKKVAIWDAGYANLDNQISDLQRQYKGSTMNNAQELKDKLSQIREMGYGSRKITVHLKNSRSPMMKVVKDAYDYYPSDWIDDSINFGLIQPKKVGRGYYQHYRNQNYPSTIAISGVPGKNSSFTTAIHELGHRYERVVDQIRDAEKAFYERRTAGEALQWMGSGYGRDEVSRFDDFLSKYMGKDYKGTAYELVSMGFQYAYTEPTTLWKDKDMADWIYGILTLY